MNDQTGSWVQINKYNINDIQATRFSYELSLYLYRYNDVIKQKKTGSIVKWLIFDGGFGIGTDSLFKHSFGVYFTMKVKMCLYNMPIVIN